MEDGPTLAELAASRTKSSRHTSTTIPVAQQAVTEVQRSAPGNTGPRQFHRENKNRPTEVSSKRPVGRHKDVMQTGNGRVRDPRFEELSGKLDPDRFRKQYGFIYDEVLPAETAELKASLKKAKDSDSQAELRAQLKELERTVARERQEQQQSQQASELKSQERAAVQQGKRPFYLKASERKKQALVQRYQALKASGSLEKAMAKRRQKVATKDHKLIPRHRRS